MMVFAGLYAVLVTPFEENGALDETSIDRLVDFYIEKQVSGLVILSVMGEGLELTEDEKMRVVRRVMARTRDRVPVVVGVNEPNTVIATQFGQRVVELGVSGLLVMPPFQSQIKPLIAHYQAIATATGVAIAILDYPPITGKLSVSSLKTLVQEVERIQAIKLEDTPTPVKIQQLRDAVGSRLRILGAQGGLYCLPELEAGSNGLMTGYSYPEHLVGILNQFLSGDLIGARADYTRWRPLLECEHKYGLVLRKELLTRRRVIGSSRLRRSNATMNNKIRCELEQILRQLGI